MTLVSAGVVNTTTKLPKGIDKSASLCYSRSMSTAKQGEPLSKRKVAANKEDGTPATANQWVANERQLQWLRYYMDPNEEETYGKAYHAALKAGYSEVYARQIMSPSLALQWVQSARAIMRTMNTEHIRNLLEDIALSRYEKASDRIAAAKLLGVDQGMFVQKTLVGHVGLEQAMQDLE